MRKVRNRIVTLALVFAFVIAGLMLVPSLLGYQRYVIESGSMTGTIDKGSVVYSKRVAADTLKVGDIITYKPPPDAGVDALVTHRIYSIDKQPPAGTHGWVFRTKGDANPSPDPWQFELNENEAALEKAHIPYVGYIYLALAQPWVRLLVIVLPSLLIIIFTIAAVWTEAGREAEEERRRLKEQRRARPAEPLWRPRWIP